MDGLGVDICMAMTKQYTETYGNQDSYRAGPGNNDIGKPRFMIHGRTNERVKELGKVERKE